MFLEQMVELMVPDALEEGRDLSLRVADLHLGLAGMAQKYRVVIDCEFHARVVREAGTGLDPVKTSFGHSVPRRYRGVLYRLEVAMCRDLGCHLRGVVPTSVTSNTLTVR